jgi:pimeloyl-ACP methyl ester carboxylesterase
MVDPALAHRSWGDPQRPVDLIFVHANGFSGLTYQGLLQPLQADWRVLAPDLRGHGHTTLPTQPQNRANWNDMRDDLVALLRSLEGPPVVLAGHSMGATLALLAAAQAPERVRSLVMLDPVILTRAAATAMRLPGGWRLARRHPWAVAALRRRRRFPDREAAFQSYCGRGSFKGWPDAVLADYVEDGFRPTPDGEVELACAPEWESSNYSAQANDAWGALRRVGRPVHILKAGQGSTCAVTARDAGRYPGLVVETLAGGTHFFAMMMPEAARAALRQALEA